MTVQMIGPMTDPLESISRAIQEGLKRGKVGAHELYVSPALRKRMLQVLRDDLPCLWGGALINPNAIRTYGLPTIEDPSLLGESFELRPLGGTG